ncbi:velvet factor-domain-containing protein [Mycena metata]|uniref:Velvet factor-domain-containing protein n=1 Tax=Mycena metata TaxID=1033252 RepID=A0AAD7JJN9_9AGAR|nr:velvet factor-domain-containing protein [Mycena metata]
METFPPYVHGFSHSELMAPPLQLQFQHTYYHQSVRLPTNIIGLANYFTEGRFAGQTLRAELREIQRPEYGRRFGAVDKRVLDDPPVVLLRFFEILDAGTAQEREMEIQTYHDILLAGLMCMAELFELPENLGFYHAPDNGCLNRTPWLFGAKFVEPYAIKSDETGQKHLLFTFSDLAVQLEGHFLLRYRFFDIFSNPSRILAECHGEPFRMYSSKKAPSLKESTTLTKRLGTQGVPVKIRKRRRAPRKNKDLADRKDDQDMNSASPSSSSSV